MRKPCCDKEKTNKGAWSKQEDQKLINYIQQHGEGNWSSLPEAAGLLRCGKSCRLRWLNYLRPDVKRGNFGEDEDDLIIKLHALLGNRWSLIAGRLPGRTDNEVKNYWNSHLRRKLTSKGSIEKPKQGLIRRPCRRRCSALITKASDGEEKANAATTFMDEEKGPISLDLDLNLSLPYPSDEETEQHLTTNNLVAAQECNEGDPSITLSLFK